EGRASETVWSGRQRWLRVATMGRACARLYSQIRKYLVGSAAAAVTLALVLFGQLEWLEYRSLDWLFELRGALFTRLAILPPTSCDWPLPVLREGAAGVGPVNVIQDNLDSQVRRAPLRTSVGDREEWSFDANLHRVATAAGLSTKPLPRSDEIFVNFRGGPGTFPSISYYRIVTGEVTAEKYPDELRDKIVLI